MIELFDETLKALVEREVVGDGGQVEVAFEAPTKEWAARRNAPTLDLYLYDIREDLDRRETQWEPVRNERGDKVGRQPPGRRFRLSYLVTAWTQRPEDEHRLLSACLRTFLRHEALPPDRLTGALSRQPLPVLLTVGYPPGPDRSLADVWSALGGELKPSLDLVATVPFPVEILEEAAKPVIRPIELALSGGGASERRAGRVAIRRPSGAARRP